MLKRLSVTGSIQAGPQITSDPFGDKSKLVKRALLVYEGEFQSMDGPVNVTLDHLTKLAANHNSTLDHLMKLNGEGGLQMKDYPPLQLDHSTSAKDTIGRLIGRIELGPYIRKDGKQVIGAYSNVCILGEENVEPVLDGRWTHLSVGVDFEKGTFSELTITPFPAAPEASLLSKLSKQIIKGHEIKTEEAGNGKWKVSVDGHDLPGTYPTNAAAMKEGRLFVEENAEEDDTKFSKGEPMNEEMKAKLKKHLTSSKKMSEEDAEKHLARCAEDEEELKKLSKEVEEEEKRLALEQDASSKLAAEKEEAEKKLAAEKAENEAKEAKMSAAREGITKLSSDFRSAFVGAQLAAKKGALITRLSGLKAQAKITPAEIKKMDIDRLSAGSQETIDAVMKTYEDREPVVMVGAFGSMKAEELHKLSTGVRMSRLEEETRANMSLLRKTVQPGEKRLSQGETEIHIDTTPHTEIENEYNELSRMMDEGKKDEVKAKLKGYLKRTLSYGSSSQDQLSAVETQKQLSALAESTNKMQAQFEELHKLAASVVGMN